MEGGRNGLPYVVYWYNQTSATWMVFSQLLCTVFCSHMSSLNRHVLLLFDWNGLGYLRMPTADINLPTVLAVDSINPGPCIAHPRVEKAKPVYHG